MVFRVGLLAFAAAFPVPAPPPAPAAPPVNRAQAVEHAHTVYGLAERVATKYVRPVEPAELMEAAARGLFEEVGRPLPEEVRKAFRAADTPVDLVNALAAARVAAGPHPALQGTRALFAAVGGFRHALDPVCGLTGRWGTSIAAADMDFGIGIELDGASPERWGLYRMEAGLSGDRTERRGPPDPPVAFPWRVRRVIPGSPAQAAGVLPGDVIARFNGAEVTPDTAPRLFLELVGAGPGVTGVRREFGLRRAGRPGLLTAAVVSQRYEPECLFGVARTADGRWDGFLDRDFKIGYLRVGAIENGTAARASEYLTELTARGCRGLILDLRWCPGGYIDQTVGLAGLFLPPGAVVARMSYRNPEEAGSRAEEVAPDDPGFRDRPVVVLVGSQTTGAGEMIAAALQDHGRAVVIGQRTVGRASISQTVPAGFGDLQYKVTVGTSLRPSGRNRMKRADSQPTDDWGVRPDPGHLVPVTPELSAELGRWADLQALRPAGSREVAAFDDPARDPFRAAALAHLRRVLGPPR